MTKLGFVVSILLLSQNGFSEPVTPMDHAGDPPKPGASSAAAPAPAPPKPKLVMPEPPPKPEFKMVESMGEKDFVEKMSNPCGDTHDNKALLQMCALFNSHPSSAEKSPPAGEYFGICFDKKVKKQTLEKLEVTPDILASPAEWEEEKPVRMEISTDFIPEKLQSDGELTTTSALMMKDYGELTKERKLAFDGKKSWKHHEERNLASGTSWHSLINDHSEVRHGKTKSGKDFVVRISTNYHKSYKPLPDGHWGQIGVNATMEVCLFNRK